MQGFRPKSMHHRYPQVVSRSLLFTQLSRWHLDHQFYKSKKQTAFHDFWRYGVAMRDYSKRLEWEHVQQARSVPPLTRTLPSWRQAQEQLVLHFGEQQARLLLAELKRVESLSKAIELLP